MAGKTVQRFRPSKLGDIEPDSGSRALLIPQGAKLLGRYDSKISFGQGLVPVVWTDIILPNGAPIQISGMAGTDVEGYRGFNDEVDNRYFQLLCSAPRS